MDSSNDRYDWRFFQVCSMTTLTPNPSPTPQDWTVADLLDSLGVLPNRVLMVPAPDRSETIAEDGRSTGGHVLPGFELSLAELFAEAEGVPPVD